MALVGIFNYAIEQTYSCYAIENFFCLRNFENKKKTKKNLFYFLTLLSLFSSILLLSSFSLIFLVSSPCSSLQIPPPFSHSRLIAIANHHRHCHCRLSSLRLLSISPPFVAAAVAVRVAVLHCRCSAIAAAVVLAVTFSTSSNGRVKSFASISATVQPPLPFVAAKSTGHASDFAAGQFVRTVGFLIFDLAIIFAGCGCVTGVSLLLRLC